MTSIDDLTFKWIQASDKDVRKENRIIELKADLLKAKNGQFTDLSEEEIVSELKTLQKQVIVVPGDCLDSEKYSSDSQPPFPVHLLPYGNALRIAMDQIKEKVDEGMHYVDACWDVDTSEMEQIQLANHSNEDIWFSTSSGNSIYKAANTVSDGRVCIAIAKLLSGRPVNTRSLNILIEASGPGFIHRLRNALEDFIGAGKSFSIDYVSPHPFESMDGFRHLHSLPVSGIRHGYDLIVVDYHSEKLVHIKEHQAIHYRTLLKPDGLLAWRYSNLSLALQGATRSVTCARLGGDSSYSVTFGGYQFVDHLINETQVRQVLGQCFSTIDVFDHAGLSALNVRNPDCIVDAWMLSSLIVAHSGTQLGTAIETINEEQLWHQKPAILTVGDLPILHATQYVVKEKHDGVPVVCYWKGDQVQYVEMLPGGGKKPVPGPAISSKFSGWVQLEKVIGPGGPIFYYIDYFPPHPVYSTFDGRQRAFFGRLGQADRTHFIDQYVELDYQVAGQMMERAKEGVVFTMRQMGLHPSVANSFYVKKTPTIDLNWDTYVQMYPDKNLELFEGIKEFDLNGKFVRDRPDKDKPNSFKVIRRIKQQLGFTEALITLVDHHLYPVTCNFLGEEIHLQDPTTLTVMERLKQDATIVKILSRHVGSAEC